MLDRTIGRVLHVVAADPEPERAARTARGHLANDACGPLVKSTLHEVILPGFESVGVDLGPAQVKIRHAGW
jgi:hypothetical protein